MTILSGEEIIRYVRSGRLVIEPFDERLVGRGSLDVRLGSEFRVFVKRQEILHAREKPEYEKFTTKVTIEPGGYFLLLPGELIHGITMERLRLPRDLAGWIEGRSSYARIGIAIHVTSGFIHPGSDEHQVLEITNLSPMAIALYPGERICQIVFEKVG